MQLTIPIAPTKYEFQLLALIAFNTRNATEKKSVAFSFKIISISIKFQIIPAQTRVLFRPAFWCIFSYCATL
jgi:hypothetical protein